MEKPQNVRLATPSDEPALRKFLDALHEENPNPANLPPDDAKVWAHVNAACRGQGAIAGIIEQNNEIIGSIGLFYNTPWWTESGIISQYWLYVLPGNRNGGRLYKSLDNFGLWHQEDMSSRLGYTILLETSFISNYKIEQRARLWGKNHRLIGMTFLAGEK